MSRRDIFYDPEAPKPNSPRPATAVALFNSAGELLLLHRKDNDKYRRVAPPGPTAFTVTPMLYSSRLAVMVSPAMAPWRWRSWSGRSCRPGRRPTWC